MEGKYSSKEGKKKQHKKLPYKYYYIEKSFENDS